MIYLYICIYIYIYKYIYILIQIHKYVYLTPALDEFVESKQKLKFFSPTSSESETEGFIHAITILYPNIRNNVTVSTSFAFPV
jgi:hypothetical protein